MIYFIRAEAVGLVRIGYTSGIKRRMECLKNASPIDLRLAALGPGGTFAEGYFHQKYRAARVRGQWFRWSDGMLIQAKRLSLKDEPLARTRSVCGLRPFHFRVFAEAICLSRSEVADRIGLGETSVASDRNVSDRVAGLLFRLSEEIRRPIPVEDWVERGILGAVACRNGRSVTGKSVQPNDFVRAA